MTTEIENTGTIWVFADHATDFTTATAANDFTSGLTYTDVQLDLTSLASTPAYRQSAKIDLGAARPSRFAFIAVVEHASAPTAGGTVDLWWAPSISGTSATANVGGVSGSDAAYTAAGTSQMQYIGSLTVKATTINAGLVGYLSPEFRYGSLVVGNSTSAAFQGDANEMHILMMPSVYDDSNNP